MALVQAVSEWRPRGCGFKHQLKHLRGIRCMSSMKVFAARSTFHKEDVYAYVVIDVLGTEHRSILYDQRPENPRFEMFSIFVSILDPDFEEGYMSGCISVTYGLLPDGWSRLFAGNIGHVAYFSRHWSDPLRISNEDFQFFGNPSSQHAVAFSSSFEIHVGLTITTKKKKDCKDACYHIYSEQEEKDKLPSFWKEDKKSKCDTLSYNSKDGIFEIHYILLKDAVDTTIDIRFESRVLGLKGLKVSGHVIAYYGDGVLDEINESMQEFFKAIIFKPEGACVSTGEKLQLKRSVISVPATGCLMIESYLKDESGEVIVDETELYRAKPTGISEWATHGEKGTFYLTVNWRKGSGIHGKS